MTNGRSGWILAIAFGLLLMAGGLWWSATRMTADPIELGLEAYGRGDWERAATLARKRLKLAGDDTRALRLLAQASVRLGLDSSAMAIYQRLGLEGMSADDLCLVGMALSRTGNRKGSLEVWAEALSKSPNHAETLFELTRAYSADGQLSKASETGRRLAFHPRWKARAESMLGAIQLARNDPSGAVAHWQQALAHESAEQGGSSASSVDPKEMTRALLQAGRSDEARRQIHSVLSAQPDSEAFWLLSRACLQAGARTDALDALKKAGSFRDANPLVPEPAPFVGAAACAACHSKTYHSQQSSRHARTFFRAVELSDLALPSPSFSDPVRPSVEHTIRRTEGGRLQQETQVDGQVLRAVVEYAFGSGDRGLTLVGRDKTGQARELRLSHYRSRANAFWDVTTGQLAHRSEVEYCLGKPLSDDAIRACFLCHVTDARAAQEASGPHASDHGIGCERCHGPGGNHLLSVREKFPDLAIANPTAASGPQVVKLCGECHSPLGRNVEPEDPVSVRFPGTTLTWSRCYIESKGALDCVTCHDPHRNVETSAAHYEARCLACHAGPARSDTGSKEPGQGSQLETSRYAPCPVNPLEGCIACHMPVARNVVRHTFFTDHFIRVHRK
jgi:tetratricopeptide (TPR) repeat protein